MSDVARTPYGCELILDMHGCDVSRFNRKHIKRYCKALCQAIDMVKCKLVFWDDKWIIILNKILPWRWLWPVEVQTNPKTTGVSAVQFILTSSVVMHSLTKRKAMYINIFSCKEFSPDIAEALTKSWFSAEECSSRFIKRI